MRLLTIVSLVINVLLLIVLAQSIARAREAKSFHGRLSVYDECQWNIGDKQQLAIYAEDFDLCLALMALPNGHVVELKW